MRIGKTSRVPRTRAGGKWTEAAFWGFLRSGLRQLSMRWPPLSDVLRENRRQYHGENKRQKWEYECAMCGGWFSAKEIEVDHLEPVGKLTSFDDIRGVVERMFCEVDRLRVTCVDCNQKRSRDKERK